MNTATTKQNNMKTRQLKNSIALILLLLISLPLMADNKATQPRHPRQMQIYSIPELGIKVGAENQPPWEVNKSMNGVRLD